MRGYGERDFVKALVPVLIGRLPDPLSPTEQDMERVADAAEKWVNLLIGLRTSTYWKEFLLDWDNIVAWNESDYELGPEDAA